MFSFITSTLFHLLINFLNLIIWLKVIFLFKKSSKELGREKEDEKKKI